MASLRITREIGEMIGRLETQLGLLREYAIKAFEEGRGEYYAEVATKLRVLLVRSRHNTPLLLEIADRLRIPLDVTLTGPPVAPPPGEPGPGETISLDRFFDLKAMYIRIDTGLVPITKREFIRAWCEQLGGAHEDWAVDKAIVAAIEFPLLVNGVHPSVIELRNCARTALKYGDHLLDRIRESRNEK